MASPGDIIEIPATNPTARDPRGSREGDQMTSRVPTAESALIRARDADDLLWSSGSDSEKYRQLRDRAVSEAVEAGMSKEQVADELGVLISDVERMVRSADTP
jgi:hypothetical protein